MADLTVENMFTERSYAIEHRLPVEALSALDRKRMLVHVLADITQKILSAPSANPVGLAITVTVVPGICPERKPDLLVTATCPQYELDDSFFSP